MKKLKFIAMIILIAFAAVSCEKEEGPQGPAGTNGTNGKDGNANVAVYGFGAQTLTATVNYVILDVPITKGMADSSIIMPYYLDRSNWYLAGGLGYAGDYLTRFNIYSYPAYTTIGFQLYDKDATTYSGADITWDSIRVFVIPATIFKSKEAKNIDLKNYQEVKAYFQEK